MTLADHILWRYSERLSDYCQTIPNSHFFLQQGIHQFLLSMQIAKIGQLSLFFAFQFGNLIYMTMRILVFYCCFSISNSSPFMMISMKSEIRTSPFEFNLHWSQIYSKVSRSNYDSLSLPTTPQSYSEVRQSFYVMDWVLKACLTRLKVSSAIWYYIQRLIIPNYKIDSFFDKNACSSSSTFHQTLPNSITVHLLIMVKFGVWTQIKWGYLELINFRLQQSNRQIMESLLRSINKAHLNSAESSDDKNRSTVKRLFSSVFSIIDSDQEISDFSENTHQSRIQKLLDNQAFVSHLQNKLRNEGLCDGYNLPIIRISVAVNSGYPHGAAYLEKAELDYYDITRIFQKFGEINKIIMTHDRTDAYIFFNSFINAYISYKLLRSTKIRGGSLEILMDWVHNNDIHPEISTEVHLFINSLNWENLFDNKRARNDHPQMFPQENSVASAKQNKLTCRYEIQIQNEREFQVARRIIGSKGCNMKRILEESILMNNQNKNYSNDNANQLLKLRLRGKGSGYKQGLDQQQSNENLHLCVSAKDQLIYNNACTRVERLLSSIYSEYSEFTRKLGRMVELAVRKINIGQGMANEQNTSIQTQPEQYESNESAYNGNNMMYRITPQKITQLLELRNKARRQLNFAEADRIRNYLRSCGVCLIDEKGRRGRATEVTAWKYLY